MKAKIRKKFTTALVAAFLMTTMTQVYSDEGMWLYDDPPLEQLEAKYGYRPDAQWLEHLQNLRFVSTTAARALLFLKTGW